MKGCTNHCRSCGGHFSSLAAFDKHRTGPYSDRSCTEPETVGLVQKKGDCLLDDPDNPKKNVIIYELATTEEYRKMRSGQES